MRFILIFILLNLIGGLPRVFAENPCNIMFPRPGNENWGEGGTLFSCGVEIPLYKNFQGELFGALVTEEWKLVVKDLDGKEHKVVWNDFEFLGTPRNRIVKLKLTKDKAFCKIFWNSLNTNVYLKKGDLEKVGSEFYTYSDFLLNEVDGLFSDSYDWANIGVNLQKNCLNLREEPFMNADKIACLAGNDWERNYQIHLKILKSSGNWMKVESTEYHIHPDELESGDDCGSVAKNKKVGWVKAIDDSGFPNIWFSVTGY